MKQVLTEEWLASKRKGNAAQPSIRNGSGKRSPKRESHNGSSAGRVFSVELSLPPKECSPNGRFHWAAKSRAVRKYREHCGYQVRNQMGRKRVGKVTLDLDFYLCRKGDYYFPKDADNAVASAKAARVLQTRIGRHDSKIANKKPMLHGYPLTRL